MGHAAWCAPLTHPRECCSRYGNLRLAAADASGSLGIRPDRAEPERLGDLLSGHADLEVDQTRGGLDDRPESGRPGRHAVPAGGAELRQRAANAGRRRATLSVDSAGVLDNTQWWTRDECGERDVRAVVRPAQRDRDQGARRRTGERRGGRARGVRLCDRSSRRVRVGAGSLHRSA